MEVGHAPAKRIRLRGDLNLGMLRVVNTLNVLKQILTCKKQGCLRNILTSIEHLGKCNELLVSPLAGLLQQTLELPADTLCIIDGLRTNLCLCRHLTFST